MRTMTASETNMYVQRLSRVASALENDYQALGLNQKQAMDFAFEVDSVCDKLERSAKLLQGDPQDPEAYMEAHFGDSPGWIEGRDINPEETYMETFNYQGNGVHPTSGSGTSVSERTESPVQDLSTYADGFSKQPSQPHVGGSPYPENGRRASRYQSQFER